MFITNVIICYVVRYPIDYLIQHFNDVSLYCLFMDDGSYDISSNSYIINTQCFSEEELKHIFNR